MTMRFACILLAAAASAFGIASPAADLDYTVSWVGNSFSGKDAWVLQDVADICVLPDGTLFTNVFWDEAGGNVQEWKDGQLVAVAGHTHGWGYEGGSAVAANSKYLFIAQAVDNEGSHLVGNSWPPAGRGWTGVSRRLRADIRQGAPFAGGHGKEGDVLQGSFLEVMEGEPDKLEPVRGLAADETHLFVSQDGWLTLYNPDTMEVVQRWPERLDKLCLDHRGHLWALQPLDDSRQVWQVVGFTEDGRPLPATIRLPADFLPGDICVDRKNRLLISDVGHANNIRIYDHLDGKPRLAGTFGVTGGILAPPTGVFGDRRFNRPTGVGADDAGNIYVASSGSVAGGSTVLECYAPDGKLRWRRFGLTFVDMCDADPRDPVDVYTKEEHFVLDYGKGPGQEWSYRGYTVNGPKYIYDPRLYLSPTNAWVRVLNGQRFLFVTNMTADYLAVHRFHPETDAEIAIPCGLLARHHVQSDVFGGNQPEKGEWIWIDRNGNAAMDADEYQSNNGADSQGVMVPDDQGTIWQANANGIRALPLQEIDSHGVPSWDYAHARNYPRPGELDEVRRLEYLPGQDLMLLGGNRGQDRNQHWKPMGPVLCLYDHWSTGAPKLRQQIVLPYEKGSSGHESVEPISFSVAGDYVFVAYTRGLKAEGLKNAFVKVLRLSDLSTVGNLSAEKALGETGLLDLDESVQARQRPNGEYLVFLEDDYKSKIILFRWKP